MREWLVIENSWKYSVFASDEDKKLRGYIPRDSAEQLLDRSITGTVWFTREESDQMRSHPEWRDTEPPPSPVTQPETKMSYDQRCYDLAAVFLEDVEGIDHEASCRELAQLIQQTIEDWIQYGKKPKS
jgi:hypothetical protein